jgi:hypothetical protein
MNTLGPIALLLVKPRIDRTRNGALPNKPDRD